MDDTRWAARFAAPISADGPWEGHTGQKVWEGPFGLVESGKRA